MPFPFSVRGRVRFAETDQQAVVYYANYLIYAEVARFAYLRELGYEYERDLLAHGLDFTIAEASVRYQAPLRFADEYDVGVRVSEVRNTSWSFAYGVARAGGQQCASISTVQVIVDRASGRPTRLPAPLRELLLAAALWRATS